MVLRPVHAERAAIHQHHDQRLTSTRYRLQQSLFWPGQIETSAIAAQKSLLANGHLFAFELAGDAHRRDHHIRIARRGNRIRRRRHIG